MKKAYHPAFIDIPHGSTLISFGDCFLTDDGCWKISCFFKSSTRVITKISLPVEVISSLTIGRTYEGSYNWALDMRMRFLSYVRLPPTSAWEKLSMEAMPKRLYKPYPCEECKRQKVYKIPYSGHVFWIPVIEVARHVFFKTFQVTHCAFYEPNLHTLASLELDAETAVIRLAKRYPRGPFNSLIHIRYLSWLFLNPNATISFSSIYQSKYYESFFISNEIHWIFDLNFIFEENFYFTKGHGYQWGNHIFISEINTAPDYYTYGKYSSISIEHPSDASVRSFCPLVKSKPDWRSFK